MLVRGCALTAFALAASPVQAASLQEQLTLFLEWFPGEYDNHEQVWQQRQDGLSGDDLHERIHHRFVPVAMPQIGEHVFFVSQTLDDDPQRIYRQRIYRVDAAQDRDALRLRIYRMRDEARYRDAWREPQMLRELAQDDLTYREGCDVFWRYSDGYFEGTLDDGACHFYSERSQQEIYISDSLRLTGEEIWISDQAKDGDGNRVFGRDVPHVNRKVRRFKGWMGLARSRVDPDYDGDDMIFLGSFSVHNEGGRQSLLDESGSPTGYGIELARLTYQNTRVPILKLGIIEEATGRTLSYTWSSTDATRIGINLRWFQAGLTAMEDQR